MHKQYCESKIFNRFVLKVVGACRGILFRCHLEKCILQSWTRICTWPTMPRVRSLEPHSNLKSPVVLASKRSSNSVTICYNKMRLFLQREQSAMVKVDPLEPYTPPSLLALNFETPPNEFYVRSHFYWSSFSRADFVISHGRSTWRILSDFNGSVWRRLTREPREIVFFSWMTDPRKIRTMSIICNLKSK